MTNPQTKPIKKILIVGSIVAAMAFSAVAIARPHGGFGPGGGFFAGKLFRAIHHLDLTEEQEVKMVRFRRKMRSEMKANRAAMKGEADQVIAELAKPNANPQIFHQMIDSMVARMSKTMHGSVDGILELHRSLSGEQRATLVKTIKEHRERRRGHGKRHRD